MIPKIIHYCWFGGNALPDYAMNCISSWKKYCPDYEIKEWNEQNFDINICAYVKEAYTCRKWAFVSDYARFWILYNYGGIYFDTDMEITKPINEIIQKGSFMGYEAYCNIEFLNPRKEHLINPGLGIGAEKNSVLYREILDYYNCQNFVKDDGSINIITVVERISRLFADKGIKLDGKMCNIEGITIYPEDFFCPINYANGKMCITDNTVSIHHYEMSWQSSISKIKMTVKRKIPPKILSFILQVKSMVRK